MSIFGRESPKIAHTPLSSIIPAFTVSTRRAHNGELPPTKITKGASFGLHVYYRVCARVKTVLEPQSLPGVCRNVIRGQDLQEIPATFCGL